MGIKDIPGTAGRALLRNEFDKAKKSQQKKDGALKQESVSSARPEDSVNISDAKLAVEKENLLASQASIEDFNYAKSILSDILDEVDEKNLFDIHGNADKIKTFLIM